MGALKKTLFIFRRDLRLHDNTGLLEALKNSEEVIP
ncbi:MAG: deoxyribodipyrimidine photo-lyase, partial [Candidatus Omnitrophica bacterium]|nr:deoxyribodipyrimidine photo-lyase [Candidatus Omnitrophota bacterium]